MSLYGGLLKFRMLTRKQKKLIERVEFALVNFVFRDKLDTAQAIAQIVEAMYDENFVFAVILAEQAELPFDFIEQMREAFKVGRVS